ncbi:hypothetical protein LZ30DRAFT_730276 [Colletotrichum cereale]|nr:hypothetical protein LZ30DRAFT_730276 [Colletotrichum cereale]
MTACNVKAGGNGAGASNLQDPFLAGFQSSAVVGAYMSARTRAYYCVRLVVVLFPSSPSRPFTFLLADPGLLPAPAIMDHDTWVKATGNADEGLVSYLVCNLNTGLGPRARRPGWMSGEGVEYRRGKARQRENGRPTRQGRVCVCVCTCICRAVHQMIYIGTEQLIGAS